jgi:hypothetical protein
MLGLCTMTGLLVNPVALPMITCVPSSMPRPPPRATLYSKQIWSSIQ